MTLQRVHPRILLVEGKDELRVMPELMEAAGVPWPKGREPVFIKDFEGIPKLLESGAISAELKASGLQALGIVVDADNDLSARWGQIRERVREAVPTFPDVLPEEGLVYQAPGGTHIGVWIMPDNLSSGMLETALFTQCPDSDLKRFVVQATTDARACGADVREVHEPKARLHAWLAWRDPPGLQLHVAVRAGLLSPSGGVHPSSSFVHWFRKLYAI